MSEARYMISEAAKKVQVESHVLRYWEEELALEIGRTDMGHRYYTEDDIQLFLCIQKLKNEGMLLRDLKPMIPELTATRKRLNAARLEKRTKSAAESGIRADAASGQSNTMPGSSNVIPDNADAVPDKPGAVPDRADIMPDKLGAVSDRSDIMPDKTGAVSDRSDIMPDKTGAVPDRASIMSGNAKSVSGKRVQTSTQNPLAAASSADTTVSTSVTAPETEVIQMTQLEQVRSLIGDVLTDVVSANNETLKKDISRKVTADVIREMDFLFQANERREEEHYRKLDMLIRQQQTHRRETIKETPIGKLKKLLT